MELDTKKLRELVGQKFKTDYRFSIEVGIHQSNISRILSGEAKNPRLCIVARMSRALGISIDEMLIKIPVSKPTINEEDAD